MDEGHFRCPTEPLQSMPLFSWRHALKNVDLAGEIFELDFRGLEDAGGLAPVTDDNQQLDYLSRGQMLLERFQCRSVGFNVRIHLIGELQHQALDLVEAFRA